MGLFSIKKTKERTHLVDPDGVPFFALGLNHIVAIRERGRDTGVFSDKFDGIKSKIYKAAMVRLIQWSFNCCGYDAADELHNDWPFFACAQVTGNLHWKERHEFYYEDVFDAGFKRHVDEVVHRTVIEDIGKPMLLGYYWNDMPQWDIKLAREQKGTDWVSAIRALPAGATGRMRYIDFLKIRYSSVDELNHAYGTGVDSFESLLEDGVLAAAANPDRVLVDDYDFLAVIARELYTAIGSAFRREDPDHLIFGDRYWLSDMPPCVIREATKWVDVLSIQYGPERTPASGEGYERAFDRARLDELHSVTGKPLMICDHNISFPSPEHDRTLWHRASSRVEAVDLYRQFVLNAVNAQYVVGYCKCQYVSRYAHGHNLLKQGMLAEDGTPYEPYASMIGHANREALVRFCTRT